MTAKTANAKQVVLDPAKLLLLGGARPSTSRNATMVGQKGGPPAIELPEQGNHCMVGPKVRFWDKRPSRSMVGVKTGIRPTNAR